MWFTEGGRFGNLGVPTGHTVKRDGEIADRYAPSLASIEAFNQVVDATPSLTQIYYRAAKRYRNGILKMRYTRDRGGARIGLRCTRTTSVLTSSRRPPTSRNQLRRLVPRPGAEDRVAAQTTLRAALRLARKDEAQRIGVPPYIVLHDHQIESLVEARPTSSEQLSDLIGPKKTAQFGVRLLEAIRAAKSLTSGRLRPSNGRRLALVGFPFRIRTAFSSADRGPRRAIGAGNTKGGCPFVPERQSGRPCNPPSAAPGALGRRPR